MFRRFLSSSNLKSLHTALSSPRLRFAAPPLTRHLTAQSGASSVRKRVEDVVPIATGHEREEIQADLEGRDILKINHPEGPFGTKKQFSKAVALTGFVKGKICIVVAMQLEFELRKSSSLSRIKGSDVLAISFFPSSFFPFEAPAIVKSYYDRRIVGCPGDEGEDEHDVVWFWLEKGKPYECPVCTQYFELQVVGPGGDPYGHGDHH
ncbi:hypothetical protein ACSQ67_011209 [Phaseolus vulgaris]